MSTRAERKAAQRAKWAAQAALAQQSASERAERERREQAERAAYVAAHPVLSGAVRVVNYVPPKGSYIPSRIAHDY